MKIFVKIKAGAKIDSIKKISANEFSISVKASPTEGKANHALIRLIAKNFGIAASRIKITKGARARRKTIEII